MVLPPAAKIELCHRAGAPWSNKDPDARLHDLQVEVLSRPERMKIVHGASRLGKALALDTPVPTPDGWTTHGELRPGDIVYGADGVPTPVVRTRHFPVRPTLRVEFEDGSSVVADANHEWLVRRGGSRRSPRVRVTSEIRPGDGVPRSVMRPLQGEAASLKVPPYTLGAWLGDGTSRSGGFTSADPEVVKEIEADGFEVCHSGGYAYRIISGRERGAGGRYQTPAGSLVAELHNYGILGPGRKRIPPTYLRASASQRLSLLQGLMDTDGYIMKDGYCQFTSCSEPLARDVYELVRTFGWCPRLSSKPAMLYGKRTGTAWNVGFVPDEPVFRLRRKLVRQTFSTRRQTFVVQSVSPAPLQDTCCIEVANPSGLYRAGEAMVTTHNSVLGGCDIICEVMTPFTKTAIIAARYDHVDHEFQYAHRGLKKLFEGHPQAFKRLVRRHSVAYHVYECETIWGAEARGYSTDSDEGAALLGHEFTRVVLGEGSHISMDIFERKIQRAVDSALMVRGDGVERTGGWISIYTTPKAFAGCSAGLWDRVQKETGRDPGQLHLGNASFSKSAWIREADILENPAYSREVYESRKGTMDKHAFDEQYRGKMSARAGAIYPEFSDHRLAPLPPAEWVRTSRLAVGFDTGAYFAATLWALNRPLRSGPMPYEIRQLGEVYTEQRTIDDNCIEVRDEWTRLLAPMLGSDRWDILSTCIDNWLVDPASQHKLEITDKLDITLEHPAKADGGATSGSKVKGEAAFPLLSTIEFVRVLFMTGQLWIGEDCPNTQEQIRKYRWKHVKSGGARNTQGPVIKEPLKEADHLLDSMRFAVVPLAQLGLPDEPRIVTPRDARRAAEKEMMFGPLRRQLARAEQAEEGSRGILAAIEDYS